MFSNSFFVIFTIKTVVHCDDCSNKCGFLSIILLLNNLAGRWYMFEMLSIWRFINDNQIVKSSTITMVWYEFNEIKV